MATEVKSKFLLYPIPPIPSILFYSIVETIKFMDWCMIWAYFRAPSAVPWEGDDGSTQTVPQEGVIGLEGSTRIDTNGHASIQGEALGGFRVQVKNFMVPTNLVHKVVGLGRDTWYKQQKTHWLIPRNQTSHRVFWMKHISRTNAKTKMAALAKSIDLQSGWTDFAWQIDWNQRIG